MVVPTSVIDHSLVWDEAADVLKFEKEQEQEKESKTELRSKRKADNQLHSGPEKALKAGENDLPQHGL